MTHKVLIVDDSKTDIMLIKNMLFDYDLRVAYDGIEAMEIVKKDPSIDIILLDLNMPRMNGFEVLEALKEAPAYKYIITIILTNYDECEKEIKGLDMGAVDYIRKPLNFQSVRKRIEIHLFLRNARKCIEEQNEILEEEVAARTKEIVQTRDTTIHALVGLLEVRNIESSNHTKRTQWMMKILCEHLKEKEMFCEILNDDYIKLLFQTAPLHDIGKVGIPDSILLKPGKLDPEEYDLMKKHTTYGVEALRHDSELESTSGFIQTAIEIIGTHHEKYDGSGYPNGLKGQEIPLCGRLMAIIDVYDALTSKRVYKPPFTHKEALKIIKNERGKHFDPLLVDVFLEIEKEIRNVKSKYEPYIHIGEE